MYDYLVDQAQAKRERVWAEIEQDRLINKARKARSHFIYALLGKWGKQGRLKLRQVFSVTAKLESWTPREQN